MYNSVTFSQFTELCNYHHNTILEHSQHPLKISLCPISVHLYSHPQAQAISNILFVSICLPFQDIAHNLKHCFFQAHVHCTMYQYFFLFYWQTVFHCMAILCFVYSFIISWTLGLFPPFGSYECCSDLLHISLCVEMCFHFSWLDS